MKCWMLQWTLIIPPYWWRSCPINYWMQPSFQKLYGMVAIVNRLFNSLFSDVFDFYLLISVFLIDFYNGCHNLITNVGGADL
jgi:hypothetical protein